MAEQLTDRHALPLLQAGQAQKELTHNEALVRLDLLTMAAAIGIADAPPTAPVAGECWIVGEQPVGDWTGEEGAIAGWTESGWRFVSAREGMCVWLIEARCDARRHAGSWVLGQVGGIRVNGEQVVGPRRPAIPAPDGGEVVDIEARTAVRTILSALSAHGLTGT